MFLEINKAFYLGTIKYIITNVFDFDLIGKDERSSEILKNTDGRFDLRY